MFSKKHFAFEFGVKNPKEIVKVSRDQEKFSYYFLRVIRLDCVKLIRLYPTFLTTFEGWAMIMIWGVSEIISCKDCHTTMTTNLCYFVIFLLKRRCLERERRKEFSGIRLSIFAFWQFPIN